MQNQKGFILPILIIVSLLILAIIAYFFSPKSLSSVNVKLPTASPIASFDPTANWKTYTIDEGIHQLSIKVPESWRVEGLYDNQYKEIYNDALKNESISFPVLNISDPKLGTNSVYKELPFNSLIITANKGGSAQNTLEYFKNNNYNGYEKVNYFPKYLTYELNSTKLEKPADWMDDKNTPPPLKTIVQRRIFIQISDNLSYEISYSIEKADKYESTVSIYNQILSTLKFIE